MMFIAQKTRVSDAWVKPTFAVDRYGAFDAQHSDAFVPQFSLLITLDISTYTAYTKATPHTLEERVAKRQLTQKSRGEPK